MAEPASISQAKIRVHISLPILVALLAFATTLGLGNTVLFDSDTYMHIAIGRWILTHYAVPHVGIFSETMPNAPWVADEWLAQAILGLLYTASRWNGVVLGTALSFAAALAILTRYLLRWLEPVPALIGMIAAAAMMLPHLLARPHIFTLPVMALWFGALVEARERDDTPPLWVLALMVLWANLHGGFIVGLAFVGIFAGEALLLAKTSAARLIVIKKWGVFTALALAACMITPFGVYTLWLPFHVVQMKFALSSLFEWQSPNFQTLQVIEIWLLAALALVLVYRPRLPLTRIAMVLLLLHMTLVHRRNADFLGLLTPLLVGPSIGAQLRNRVTDHVLSVDQIFSRLARPTNFLGTVVATVLVLVSSVSYLAFPLARQPDPNAPIAALQAAREYHLTDGRVFNQYGFGDYLIFSGIAPFIDGRAELYGDAFIKRYLKAVWGQTDDLSRLLDENHITWSLFAADGTAAALMEHLPGWRRIYEDKDAVIYVRVESAGKFN